MNPSGWTQQRFEKRLCTYKYFDPTGGGHSELPFESNQNNKYKKY